MMLAFCSSLTVLMVLVTEVSTLVPPPENVTVSCNNFQTTVYWNYSELLHQPRFKLNISGDMGWQETFTKQHHYDLSPLIWNANELDRYFVMITAIDETEESASQKSSIFTFNSLLTADICKLDFPAVDVSMKDMEVTVSFDNPYHLYTELRESRMGGDDKTFSYQVTYENTNHQFNCKIEDKVCRYTFTILENKEQYCVSLEGDAMGHRVMFNRTGPICGHEDKTISLESSLLMLLPLIIIGIVAFVVFVTIRLCKRSMRKITLSNFPKTLASVLSNPHANNIMYLQCEIIAHISGIEPATTTSQSLLETSEEEEEPVESPTTSVGSSAYPQYPISSGQVGEVLCGDDSVGTDSRTFEVEDMDLTNSGYDKPHVLVQEVEVEMSAGDVVVGYGLSTSDLRL
ncbi:LOW QUALITY PROTEIN: interferon gamma receptor 1 [Coregonus clupeaformis]|uniref:LOW QUALITY PROTEIN: interferon gamma receptor 1 n=1 Tax=Coregonus clupeaformis TaxID=59861 RepID=UPI001E1C6C77|nr:LOW QUALITY PROTEIN: interferon gamma receptor 1 [Coregonus clupeaformis]